jgi:hypothetical protein
MQQLVGSTIHWGKLVTGYGAKHSPDFWNLIHLDRGLADRPNDLAPLIGFARRNQISHFLIHLDRIPPEGRERWIMFSHRQSTCILYIDENTLFFSIDTPSCEAQNTH